MAKANAKENPGGSLLWIVLGLGAAGGGLWWWNKRSDEKLDAEIEAANKASGAPARRGKAVLKGKKRFVWKDTYNKGKKIGRRCYDLKTGKLIANEPCEAYWEEA